MKIRHYYIREVILATIVCFCLLLSSISPLGADMDRQILTDSGAADTLLSSEKVTLAKKSATMVSTQMGERYKISSATMIVGLNGEQILIPYLLLPCDTKIVFETSSDGTRLVHRIQVLNIHENATNRMLGKPH